MLQFANSLNLINWLIRLLSYREQKRAALFKDFIEPLFKDLETAYVEYVKALTEIKQAAGNITIPLYDLGQRARRLRDETAVLRHKCAAIGQSYGQSLTGKSAAIDDFLAGAPSLFSSTFERSDFFELIELIGRLTTQARFQCGDERRERDSLLEVVQGMLDTASRNWRSICGEYGRLRAIYCEPIPMFAGQGKQQGKRRLQKREVSVFDPPRPISSESEKRAE